MSTLSEKDHLDPQHPLYYAPRSLRERSGSQLASAHETKSEPIGRPPVPPAAFEPQPANAISVPRRHPLDPEVIKEPPGLARDLKRRTAFIGVAGGFAAAAGVAIVAAALFIVTGPTALRSDGNGSSFSASSQSLKIVPPQPGQATAAPKSALNEFQGLLGQPKPSQSATHEQSDQLLKAFVQWSEKPAPTQAGAK
jgi:hypothetical protein